ncbi:hypothetical protein GCM10009722_03710 [Williamsia deligens]
MVEVGDTQGSRRLRAADGVVHEHHADQDAELACIPTGPADRDWFTATERGVDVVPEHGQDTDGVETVPIEGVTDSGGDVDESVDVAGGVCHRSWSYIR